MVSKLSTKTVCHGVWKWSEAEGEKFDGEMSNREECNKVAETMLQEEAEDVHDRLSGG